jgi:hypothetical protein
MAREATVGGLNGSSRMRALEGVSAKIALGGPENGLPSRGLMIVVDALPPDIDGLLDPTEAFYPLGYVLDMPNRVLAAFDPRVTPLRASDAPPDGAVVSWLSDSNSRRPFVPLGRGRALLDTGSSLGLALTRESAQALGVRDLRGEPNGAVRDLSGNWVSAQRIAPLTVSIGPLTLGGVPTDVLAGAGPGTPMLLGRDALRPFELAFDPVNRLIRITPE